MGVAQHAGGFVLLSILLSVCLQNDFCQASVFIKTSPTKETNTTFLGIASSSGFASEKFVTASFLGIPFAKPPARFSKAELATPESEVFWAIRFGDICQQQHTPTNKNCEERFNMSENCLYLNIYVPLPTFTAEDVSSSSTEETISETTTGTTTEATFGTTAETTTEATFGTTAETTTEATFGTTTSVSSSTSTKNNSGNTTEGISRRKRDITSTLRTPQTLNITKTLPSNDTKFAVLVYIHGGSFTEGSGNCFDGSTLAGLGNIIVVTINYRLGPFGFLSTDDDVIPGNLGLWDQHVAIKWVKKHISAFGGDPNRITVGGQSAGSYSSIFQALYQGNNGLFQRVIAQSGTPVAFKSVNLMGYSTTLRVARSLNCSVAGTKQDIKTCLMNQTAQDLAKVPQPVLVPGSLALQPSLDNDFVRADPYDVFSQMAASVTVDKSSIPPYFSGKDLLIGIDAHDGDVVFLLLAELAAGNNFTLLRELLQPVNKLGFKNLIREYFQKQYTETIDDILLESVIDRYFDWENPHSKPFLNNRLIELLTDVYFAQPVLDTASGHAPIRELTAKPVHQSSTAKPSTDQSASKPYNQSLSSVNSSVDPPSGETQTTVATAGESTETQTTVATTSESTETQQLPVSNTPTDQNEKPIQGLTFVYRFNLPTPAVSYLLPWFLGTGHSSENDYVFGSPQQNWTNIDRNLSMAVITYWSNFVKTGDPNRNGTVEDVATPTTNVELPFWPEYNNQDEKYLEISNRTAAESRLRASYRHFWTSYIPRLRSHLQEVYNDGANSAPVKVCPTPTHQSSTQDKLRSSFHTLIFLLILILTCKAVF